MTNEELNSLIKEMSDGIEKLSQTDKPLTKAQEKEKNLLKLKKETLEKIKEARAQNKPSEELKLTITYGLISSWGHRNPFLLYLIHARVRGNIFYGI